MKHKHTSFSLALIAISAFANAQVNVSTTTQKKVAVLEEMTGNFCTYCPDGHKRADDIESTTNTITLKIQTGDFAGTDPVFGGNLKTTHGEAIAAEFDNGGWPNGTVSRRASYTSIGRGDWKSACQAINTENAPVNLYIDASVDVASKTLDVEVEYYYTANEANSTNYLHIGYYQDNIPAYQYDPGFYPENFYLLEEEIYEFDHCFREMINGNWGEVIGSTTLGSTAIINKSVSLPASFGAFDLEPSAIKVFAYVTTTEKGEILNAIKTTPAFSNFPSNDEISLIAMHLPSENEDCVGNTFEVAPKILVGTSGGDNLTKFKATYGVNGNNQDYTWTGNIGPSEKVAVELPTTSFTVQSTNTGNAVISLPNDNADADDSDNSESTSISAGLMGKSAYGILIEAKTDQYAVSEENKWELYDGAGVKIAESGQLQNSSTHEMIIDLPVGTDCYYLKLRDTYGDGFGSGYVRVYDVTNGKANKTTIVRYTGSFKGWVQKAIEITADGELLNIDASSKTQLSIYPNPTNSTTTIEFDVPSVQNTSVEVLNMLGQAVWFKDLGKITGNQKVIVDANKLKSGIYFVSIKVGSEVSTHKLTVSK